MFRKSPLNYVGGKFKLLPQLKILFPEKINTFVDLFCGGLNVTLNTEANQYIANDVSTPIINLYEYLQDNEKEKIIEKIEMLLDQYKISLTNECGYLAIRNDYNTSPDPLKLFILISNSFNHQLRFNRKGEFNMPFGRNRSYFNKNMRKNLLDLIDFLHKNHVQFENKDFRQIELNGSEFIYCDPPYQNTTAVYNDKWSTQEDATLLDYLDNAHKKKCKFALSCVLLHNGIENTMIKKWSTKYNVNAIDWKYGNSNYHKKNRSSGVEVCITN